MRNIVKHFVKKQQPDIRETLMQTDPGLSISSVVATAVTDLDPELPEEKNETLLVCTENGVRIYQKGSLCRELPFEKLKLLRIVHGVGCFFVEADLWDGKPLLLARGNLKAQKQASDFVRRTNAYQKKKSHKGETVCKSRETKRPKASGKQYLFRFLKMAKWEWKPVLISVILFLFTTVIGLIIPYFNRILIDDYIRSETGKVFFSGFLGVILSILCFNLLRRGFATLRGFFLATAGNRFVVRLRGKVFDKIRTLSISKISSETSGELMKRVNGDTAQIKRFLIVQFPNIMEQSLLLIAVSVLLLLFDWKLALFIVLPAPLVVLGFRLFWRLMKMLSKRVRDLNARGNAVLHDIFSGIRVVKSYGMEQYEEKRYLEVSAAERDARLRQERIWAILMPILQFLAGIGEYIILYYVGNKMLGGSMTAGQMSQISSYSSMIYAPLTLLLRAPRMLINMLTSLSAIFQLLDEPVEVADSENPIPIKDIEGKIELDHVSFGYNEVDEVLHDISLTVNPGEFVGIVGKSGVGKSTLINLIMRMYDVDEGTVRIDGNDIRDIPQAVLRSHMGVVLQETFLFSGTVWQNLTYAKPDATKEEIIQAAKLAGAHSFILKLPDAYQTYIGEKGYTLSGGERQRIAIARALLHNPSVLILDEATSALDTETEKLIQDALKELTKGRTTIAIAHRLSTLRNATRLVVLDKGRIAEVGTHDELMKQNGIYYGLVMAQRELSQINS